MARSDRRTVASILERARKFAIDVEARTSIIPLPAAPPTDEKADRLALYDTLVTDDSLRRGTRRLFSDEHYAQAVGEAYKLVNNAVKEKARTPDKDGQPMMFAVFDPKKPILKLNTLRSESERSEQEGYKFIFGGVMGGIRNPRAHEHDLADEAAVAIEMLVMANHLLRVLGRAIRAPKKRVTTEVAISPPAVRSTPAQERRIADASEQLDRCAAMVAARVAYAAMWHRGGRWQPLKEQRLKLERSHPLDVPETVLEGTSEWKNYLDTEKRLRHDTTTPREERAKAIEDAGASVHRLLAAERQKVRS